MQQIFESYSKVVKLITLFLIIIIFSYVIKNYFQPFFVIVAIALLSYPIHNKINKGIIGVKFSAIISIGIVNIIIFMVVFYFGNILFNIVISFYNNNINLFNVVTNEIEVVLRFDLNKVIDGAGKVLMSSAFRASAALTSESIVSYFIGNISTYFLLVDKSKFELLMVKLISKKFVIELKGKVKNLKAVFKVEILLVVLSTVIICVGFTILSIPNSVFLGVICGILDLLPYVGTAIVFIPIIIYNVINKNYLISIGLILLFILVQVIREILEAKYLSSKLNLHPLIIMISIYVAIKIFGVVGMVLGPIYCVLARDIIYDDI